MACPPLAIDSRHMSCDNCFGLLRRGWLIFGPVKVAPKSSPLRFWHHFKTCPYNQVSPDCSSHTRTGWTWKRWIKSRRCLSPFCTMRGDILLEFKVHANGLPLEIWEEIFVQCLPWRWICLRFMPTMQPILLAEVLLSLEIDCVCYNPQGYGTPLCFNILPLQKNLGHFHLLSMLRQILESFPLSIEIWQEMPPSYQIEWDIMISILPFFAVD